MAERRINPIPISIKHAAKNAVKVALKRGHLVRPETCGACGNRPKPGKDGRSTIQGHHTDYGRPLDVEWICATCHRAETPGPVGEDRSQAKLTWAAVALAREQKAAGVSVRGLARQYGVCPKTLRAAIAGKTWSPNPQPPEQP